MSDWVGMLWLFLLLAMAGWVLASAVTPLLFGTLCSGHSSATVKRRLWLIALLPWLLPLFTIVAASLLAGAKKWGWLHDHCLFHTPDHPHFCFEHLPQLLLSYAHAVIAVLLAAALVVLLIRHVRYERHQAKNIETLSALAPGRRCLRILDNEQILGFAAGLVRPKIFLSRGLLNRLNKRERRIVVAHEIAHIRHHDLWLNVVLETLLLLHLPRTATELRRHWRQAMEALADDRVVERYGATDVAATLLVLTKAAAVPVAPASVIGANPLHRIERLLRNQETTSSRVFEWGYWIALCGFGALIIATHHLLETLLGFVVGV